MRKLKTKKNKKRSRIVKLFVAFVLSGIIVIVCVNKWNTWFNNPIEPVYTNHSAPGRIQLSLGNDGQFSRNISWQCGDMLETSQLLFVKQATIDTIKVAAKGSLFHTQGGVTVLYCAELTGLTEGRYSYCVYTGEKQSGWYSFTVNAGDNFRFVYIGDIQDTIGGTANSLFTSINRSEKNTDFWVLGGDIIERPHDQYWNEYHTSMDSIAQTTPVIACPGNHEYRKGIPVKLDERFIHTFSYFIDSRRESHAVFDTRYGNTAIILLDSNRDTWTLFSQRRWLKQALQKTEDAKWKIVVLHHPLYSVRGKFKHFFIRRMFDPLIRKYGVDVVLQGHEHCYARMITKNKYKSLTTPVYLISQSSPKDYRINSNRAYDRFGNGWRFFQTFDVSSDTFLLKAYTEHGELYDHVCIVKTSGQLHVIDLASDFPEHFDINSSRNKRK